MIWKFEKEVYIAMFTLLAIAVHLVMHFALGLDQGLTHIPLFAALAIGGIPLTWELLVKLFKREFGSDLLAGISIVTSVLLGEYLAGTLVVLMLSGGAALEHFAIHRASSVLEALAKRMPHTAHRKKGTGMEDISINDIQINDELVILPNEICPVDGVVIEGHGRMDEAYLTGEPFMISKTPGSTVISGAVNQSVAITIRASRLPIDSRYAKIMQVMREAEESRPRIRRIADQMGAWYTPLAVLIAISAWYLTGDPMRFLSVLVIATPCPLLIAIPVSIIGSISLAANRGIIIKNPAILESIDQCTTMILDKTGTLTYGRPQLTNEMYYNGFGPKDALSFAASLEKYSKHPLAMAIVDRARRQGVSLVDVNRISEPPGQGLSGEINGRQVMITSRKRITTEGTVKGMVDLGELKGLECIVVIDNTLAAHFRFHDQPRKEGKSFIQHLNPRHKISRVMIVSGDREEEVRYLANEVGIDIIYASQSPEEKIAIVRKETSVAKTMYLGDGINDAPALTAATVGIALGQNSDVTSQAAGAVIMDSSLAKVDELMHIGRRMRRVALQSALGGMFLSVIGMLFAAGGYLPPVAGAIGQEIIDLFAVLNALRTAFPPKDLTDFS